MLSRLYIVEARQTNHVNIMLIVITVHYIQVLSLVVSEILSCFSYCKPGADIHAPKFGPQGHGWQYL